MSVKDNRLHCDGCQDVISAPQDWYSLWGPGDPNPKHYHDHCWETGWHTGIEPKGDWPTPEGKPPANLPPFERVNLSRADFEDVEPAFDHAYNHMLRKAMDHPLDPKVFEGQRCDTCGSEGDHSTPDCALPTEPDPVNNPSHYRWLPNGIEVIDITETLNFCLGNAIKYILRADHKGKPIEDLEKARWYLDREIAKRKASNVV